jgi:hypothetical protein
VLARPVVPASVKPVLRPIVDVDRLALVVVKGLCIYDEQKRHAVNVRLIPRTVRPYLLGTAQPNRLHYQPHQRRHENLHAAEIGFECDNQRRAINWREERILIRSERDEIGRKALPVVHGQHGVSSILPWSSATSARR